MGREASFETFMGSVSREDVFATAEAVLESARVPPTFRDETRARLARSRPPRSVHRLDEPAGLSLSMVASPQCRFRFARQNHFSASARAANFRLARKPGANRTEHMYDMATTLM